MGTRHGCVGGVGERLSGSRNDEGAGADQQGADASLSKVQERREELDGGAVAFQHFAHHLVVLPRVDGAGAEDEAPALGIEQRECCVDQSQLRLRISSQPAHGPVLRRRPAAAHDVAL